IGRVVATPVDTTFARRACSACDAGPGMAVTTLRLRAMDATAAVVTSVEVCIVSVIIVSAYRRGTLSGQKLTANLSRGSVAFLGVGSSGFRFAGLVTGGSLPGRGHARRELSTGGRRCLAVCEWSGSW